MYDIKLRHDTSVEMLRAAFAEIDALIEELRLKTPIGSYSFSREFEVSKLSQQIRQKIEQLDVQFNLDNFEINGKAGFSVSDVFEKEWMTSTMSCELWGF